MYFQNQNSEFESYDRTMHKQDPVISKITTLLRGFQNFSHDENETQSGPRDLSMERLRDIIQVDSIDLWCIWISAERLSVDIIPVQAIRFLFWWYDLEHLYKQRRANACTFFPIHTTVHLDVTCRF